MLRIIVQRSLLFEVQVFEIDYGQLRLHGVPVTVDSSTLSSCFAHKGSIYVYLVLVDGRRVPQALNRCRATPCSPFSNGSSSARSSATFTYVMLGYSGAEDATSSSRACVWRFQVGVDAQTLPGRADGRSGTSEEWFFLFVVLFF